MQQPTGGHAVYVDAKRFLTRVPREEFIAQTLVIELYLEGGIRAVEIGTLLADRDPQSGENRYPEILDCAVNLALLGLKQRFYETIKFEKKILLLQIG